MSTKGSLPSRSAILEHQQRPNQFNLKATRQMQKTSDLNSEPHMQTMPSPDAPRLSARDVAKEGFILLAMALVTLAMGTALYLQFDLGFIAAAVCALSVYLGLLAGHALVHRNSAVSELKAELEVLETRIARATGQERGVQKRLDTADPDVKTPVAFPDTPFPGSPEKGGLVTDNCPDAKGPPVLSNPGDLINPQSGASGQAADQDTLSVMPLPKSKNADSVKSLPIVNSQFTNPQQKVWPDLMNTGAASADGDFKSPSLGGELPPLPKVNRVVQPPERSTLQELATQQPGDFTSKKDAAPKAQSKSNSKPSRPPRESDVAMIQGLIKKLADEVNATTVASSSTEPHLAKSASTPPSLPSKKKSIGPVSIAAQVIASQSLSQKNETANTPEADSAEPDEHTEKAADDAIKAADDAIEASVDALHTTARAMREKGQSSPEAERLPSSETTTFWPGSLMRAALSGSSDDGGDGLLEFERTVNEVPPSPPVAPGVFAIISEALNAGRVDVLLDPILGLENRRARHFEISVRLRDIDNSVIDTQTNRESFAGTGLDTMLDRATLSRTATVALQLDNRGRHGAVFSKVAAESFSAEAFINDVYAAFQERSGLSSQLVMTLSQSHVRRLGTREWITLEDLKSLGFRFAIASVTDLDMDFEDLGRKGFAFAKLDAEVFLNGLLEGEVRVPSSDICQHLADMDFTVIVDRIDNDSVLKQVRELGVEFGQGKLFGGARTVKAQALKSATGNAA